jgi:hypothetical protein
MRRFSLIFLLYLAVGVVFAVYRNQLSTPLLRDIVEALLYILLWPLTAFGLIGPINL